MTVICIRCHRLFRRKGRRYDNYCENCMIEIYNEMKPKGRLKKDETNKN